MLNQTEQQAALKLARQTLEKYFKPQTQVETDYKQQSVFQEKRGVFVTLNKQGQLRGCIGLIETSDINLGEAISKMALAAAFNDNRFESLAERELSEIEIEISVLSVPQKIKDVSEIVLGKHGVIVKKGYNSGVFLPQVAEETGWTKAEFLSELCTQKANLAADCWQDPQVDFYIFTAQVFKEK